MCAGALTRPSTRHLLPKNFEKTALRKRVGIFTVKMRAGHIYGNYCTHYILYDCTAQEKKKMSELLTTLMVNLFPTEDAVLSLNCCVLPQVRHQAQEGQLQEQQEV